MKTFNSIEEMKPYYNEKTNTYEFVEEGIRFDINLAFDLKVDAHINAGNIKAGNINAWNITARNINAWNITARNITAGDITARNIFAWNITAGDIDAGDINAWNITARNITAGDITAWNIVAKKISYYAVCYAYKNIICEEIKGRRKNAKHFVSDGTITIKGESK